MPTFPPRLRPGDTIRVIAPSRSLSIISAGNREIAERRLRELGLSVTFGRHVEECDAFYSSTIASRVADLHEAFADPGVKAILTVIGGFNSNQILRKLDWPLIGSNPKVFCGYSDITVLQNAMLKKANLVSYSGPHFSTFAMRDRFEFTLDHFRRCLFFSDPINVVPSLAWSDDPWYRDQDQRHFVPNTGLLVLNTGRAEGTIIGGNLCTLNLLQGSEYMPALENSLLFLEDDEAAGALTDVEFDRNLQSLIHLPDFAGVRGVVIGRFQRRSEMTESKLRKIIASKSELSRIPVIANADFGHTDPCITFPIGGRAEIAADGNAALITITGH